MLSFANTFLLLQHEWKMFKNIKLILQYTAEYKIQYIIRYQDFFFGIIDTAERQYLKRFQFVLNCLKVRVT
jgi:hypothetical protein